MWLTHKRKQHQPTVIQDNPTWTDPCYDQNITIHCNSSILHEGKLPSTTFQRGWISWGENKVSLSVVSTNTAGYSSLGCRFENLPKNFVFVIFFFKHGIIQATFPRMSLYCRDVLALELFSVGLAEDTVPGPIVYSFPLVPIVCFLLWGRPVFGCISLYVSTCHPTALSSVFQLT